MNTSGIVCLKCRKRRKKDVKMMQYCTQPRDDYVIRYRKCPECGFTRKTLET